MGLHIALHDRFFVSLQSLHDLTKHVEARYKFLSAITFCYCGKLLKVSSYPKCYFNSLNILWINNTVCGDSGIGLAEFLCGFSAGCFQREFTLW